MVFISIDRYLSIAMPSKFLFRKSKYFQMLICIAILVFHMVLFTPIIEAFNLTRTINYGNKTNLTNSTVCEFEKSSYPLDLINVFDGSVAPFTLMILFTSLMLRTLFNTRKKTNKQGSCSSKQRDVRFAMISVILIIIFFVLTFPLYLLNFFLYYLHLKPEQNVSNLISSAAILFIYINYGLLFYSNIIVNKMFREEFYLMIFSVRPSSS